MLNWKDYTPLQKYITKDICLIIQLDEVRNSRQKVSQLEEYHQQNFTKAWSH
jgi:hypothetical protein